MAHCTVSVASWGAWGQEDNEGDFSFRGVSTFTGFDGIDILDGPPEITLKFEPGKVIVSTVAGRLCKPVTGGTIFITAAKDISEEMEANLTFRVRYRTKHSNSSTWTLRYHLLMFPAAGEPTTTSNKR